MHRDRIAELHDADPYFATTLAKGLALLRAFAPDGGWLGNGALAARTGLPKATVTRLVRTLTRLGYLRHDPQRGQYALGSGMLELVHPFLSQLPVRRIARPLMQTLADAVHGAVSIGMASGTQMILIECCLELAAPNARPDIGASRPMATTALGRAYLAALDDSQRLRLHDDIRRDWPGAWAPLRRRLEEEAARHRSFGYALGLGENRKGINAAAVALHLPDQPQPLVMNCAVAESRVATAQFERQIAPRLLELSHAVQREMGHG